MRNLASLWALFVLLIIAVVAPARSRNHVRPPVEEPTPSGVPHRTVSHDHVRPSTPEPAPLVATWDPPPEPEWLDPTETDPVRPYVTQHERHRQVQEREEAAQHCPACGAATTPDPTPPAHGDGLDDVRAELSPLVRQWLAQREEKSTVGVVR
ncbi:hypothetical protein FHX37_3248 [Haloactinospora alba]|uniref:Uncharacterized protein n=1 Tax=Haloactinospora alba TaxID=405555 RepID=A0A543NN48_9ACTN|nr:hypothetical protein [Haloactinospora alba]TQN33243.1 hypothetical protein FHX37_3248 [Haloactinospora alba]